MDIRNKLPDHIQWVSAILHRQLRRGDILDRGQIIQADSIMQSKTNLNDWQLAGFELRDGGYRQLAKDGKLAEFVQKTFGKKL